MKRELEKLAKHYQIYKASLKEISKQAEVDVKALDETEENSSELDGLYEILTLLDYQAEDMVDTIDYLAKLAKGGG